MVRQRLQRLLSGARRRLARVVGRPGLEARSPGDASLRATEPSHPNAVENPYAVEGRRAPPQVEADEVDRLVRLAFAALLRREPDQDALIAYREGFANGTTFQALVEDILGSDEYGVVKERTRQRQAAASSAEETHDDRRTDDLETAVALLTDRLVEKGCRLQLGAVAATEATRAGGSDARRRLRSVLLTLSVLDRL